MGIFERREAFLGEAQGLLPLEIVGLCTEIRQELGRKAYLLDAYLSIIAQRMTAIDALDYIRMDKNTVERLLSICIAATRDDKEPESPFADKVRDTVENYPIDNDDKVVRAQLFADKVWDTVENYLLDNDDKIVRAQLCSLLLAGDYIDAELSDISETLMDEADKLTDIGRLSDFREGMESICGADILDRLDKVIQAAWMPVTPLQLFRQGCIYEILQIMTIRDDETQKLLLSLILD